MAASSQAFSGNLKKAMAGLKRINLEGLRWRVFDAKGQVLGRLASRIATVLQGKDKPTYAPNREDGDMCIVLNAKDISVTGRKLTHKFYRWHTGQDRDRKLRIFAANDHPFNDRPLETFVMPPRNVREMRPRARRALVRSQKKLEQGSTMVNTKRKKEDVDASCDQVKNTELKEMVLALLNESDLHLSEDIVEAIVDNTFKQADSNGDGKIDEEEWEEFVMQNPAILRNMTLPYLIDITMAFPSFVMYSETNDADIII